MPSPHAAQVAPDDSRPVSSTVEDIARSYLKTTDGDASLALRCAISDALADLLEADRRTNQRDRLIYRGYVRGLL